MAKLLNYVFSGFFKHESVEKSVFQNGNNSNTFGPEIWRTSATWNRVDDLEGNLAVLYNSRAASTEPTDIIWYAYLRKIMSNILWFGLDMWPFFKNFYRSHLHIKQNHFNS